MINYLKNKVKSLLYSIERPVPPTRAFNPLFSYDVSDDFLEMFGNEALEYIIKKFEFKSVLDIGSGAGVQASVMEKYGKEVTRLDLGKSIYFKDEQEAERSVVNDYLDYIAPTKFDCVWASHVLEHQPNVNLFLKKIHGDLRENGILAITVPPMKHAIVGGHLSVWNAGLLLYNLVLAGFDCSNVHIKQYAYNISVVLKKSSINVMPDLAHDAGDIEALSAYLPAGLNCEGFGGNIESHNWQ